MSEIARSTSWNPGGGNWLELVPAAAVASYVRASDSSVPEVTLLPGFQWLLIYTALETLQYAEDAQVTDNGTLYTVQVKGFSPADSATKRAALESVFRYQKMLVRFRDNARLTRLAGTKIEPMELSFALTTDQPVAGNRGYTLTLKGTLTAPAAYED